MKIDMSNLKDATEQQVFEQAARHLLTQNAKSVNDDGDCVYRGPNGIKCGAGCFISDEQYLPQYENSVWQAVARRFKEGSHIRFICKIQDLHDDNPVEQWKEKLIELGREHKLNVSFIHEEFK